ncbi:MAG TPA: tripartite tricarboxylate transporter permease [Candidatus Binataceae bacterium]|nr:tripartite tricarboxylate transporter permease [Candidatus Binataceae bacterium]
MFHETLLDLWYGFGVALEPHNLMWLIFGVLVGNLVGVLPGMGALSAMSILLPVTYALHPVPAILMLAGVFYGALYGGAIGAILLNLPVHPPHAVTCLDGYPLAMQGKGGMALCIAMIASFLAASFGIIVMIFFSPILSNLALKFGPAEIFLVMLLGLLAGATMSHGSALKGVTATLLGMLCGLVGTDINTGLQRFTFGFPQLWDGVNLVAISLGLFGVADFLNRVNRKSTVSSTARLRFSDMRPSMAELKQSLLPMLRGTLVGTLFGAMPGTSPTVTTFVSYALERRVAKAPERFGRGALEGVAGPEAAAHSKTQIDFIPTMCLGIPGDPLMALILGALMIQGIAPGPLLITEHPDLFWGLIASFWLGNVLLMVLNLPLVQLWVKLLQIPYRYLFPSALFFIALGVFSTHNSLFDIGEVLVFGVFGAILMSLNFPLAPILLGFVLGPLVEENFREALRLSNGDLSTFVQSPIAIGLASAIVLLIAVQIWAGVRHWLRWSSLREDRAA